MTVQTLMMDIATRGNTHIQDITDHVVKRLDSSDREEGIVTLFVPGSTAALTTIEYEDGVVQDLSEVFERLVPEHDSYHHHLKWHDNNGHAHVRAALLGPSLTIPFKNRRLLLGTWQQIVLVDFDNRPRSRRIICQIMGE